MLLNLHKLHHQYMMKVKGVNFWPSAVDEVVFRNKEIPEYRGEVSVTEDGREEIMVEVEFREASADLDKESIMTGIAEELRGKIGIGFRVSEWVGAPLSTIVYQVKTAKTRRWTDRRLETR